MLIKQRTHFRDSRHRSGTNMESGGSILGLIVEKLASAAASAIASETEKALGKSAVDGVSKGLQKGAEEAGRRVVTHIADKASKGRKGKSSGMETTATHSNIDDRSRRLLDTLKSGSGIKTTY